MNLDNIPSKSEVMGWNSESLVNYLRRMRLSGCDTVVKRSGMNGAKFLTMSGSDLQKFPKVHVPLITKLCNDINQGGKKKGLFHRPQPPRHPNQGLENKAETWDSEEFEQDSDPDYEEPDADDCEDNYICTDFQQGEDDDEGEYDYELPPSETPNEIPSHFRSAKPLDESDYIDSIRNCLPKEQSVRPPQRPDSTLSHPAKSKLLAKAPRLDSSPQRPKTPVNKSKSPGAAPHIDRRTKPRSSGFSKTNPDISEGKNYPKNTLNDLHSTSQEPRHPESTSYLFEENEMLQNSQMAQDMDPQWYVGPMTRTEAEVSLRQINKDGTFLIRDSSKNATDQPYTLMVLNKQKVYNIQIRFHGYKDGYSLGTGLSGTETFPSVRDIITYYTKTHLMLIDAMERGTGAQHECCLMHPARR
ncbi:lymphocyte cytosolic protein 2 [Salminus brasiliensis]|uniref:lymphocyte cytosolic protein 2 n=1 Tax=Salminus brasiliensis TaxID=930266 RepID=UPI003B8303BD